MKQSTEAKYCNAYHRERPAHTRCDAFSIRHPKMALGQRAKIFSPFAALRGFEEAIDSKLERYVSRHELTEEEQEQVNRTLLELVERMKDRRARLSPVTVSVVYYVPCSDENHEAYGKYGKYASVSGTLRQIDPILRGILRVEDTVIEFPDILEIRILEGE